MTETAGYSDQVAQRAPLLGRRRTFWSQYSFSSMFRKQHFDAKAADPTNSINGFDETEGKKNTLKKELNVWDLMAYGLASTLGSGILVTVGQVAHNVTGPSVVYSFLFAGFASFLSALCYSEFAARIPLSGSAYSFAYISLGEVVAWFVGWNLTLEYAISASAVAGGWSSYVMAAASSVGADVPKWMSNGYELSSLVYVNPFSALIVLACTGVLLVGMKESARFNVAMTLINVSLILFFIIAGSFHVDPKNWHPFTPFGFAGTWAGVGKVFFSYIGFDAVSTLAGEVKNPTRDLPIGIVGTLSIVTGLYVVVSLVLTGMQNYSEIDVNAPLAVAFQAVHWKWASIIISFGSVTTISATCLASLVGQPRIFYQMAQDGLIFPIFGKVNAKTGVPVFGTVITGVISALIALFFNLNVLLDMISIGTLLAFTVVCGGVIILRYEPEDRNQKSLRTPLHVLGFFGCCVIFSMKQKFDYHLDLKWTIVTWVAHAIPMIVCFFAFFFFKQTNIPTTFKTPLVPLVPCLGILMNTWFILSLSIDSIYRLLIWTALGMALYFGYGIRNSALNREEPKIQLENEHEHVK
eukprot:TRINITY_DN3144_c0_g2_i1.p1 TRINITY_DN3144_c0_g2~~TRINITY_DN3144_c0_g2_i1.p1  ORF type:complete len:580 (+),score=112.20 TRINITY_DN3144_c0_g2_i1:194-1933(+)